MRFNFDIVNSERGHAPVGIASLVPLAGAIVLGIGAAAENGVAAIIGAVVLGLGVVAVGVVHHQVVDWDVYRRLEQLEKK